MPRKKTKTTSKSKKTTAKAQTIKKKAATKKAPAKKLASKKSAAKKQIKKAPVKKRNQKKVSRKSSQPQRIKIKVVTEEKLNQEFNAALGIDSIKPRQVVFEKTENKAVSEDFSKVFDQPDEQEAETVLSGLGDDQQDDIQEPDKDWENIEDLEPEEDDQKIMRLEEGSQSSLHQFNYGKRNVFMYGAVVIIMVIIVGFWFVGVRNSFGHNFETTTNAKDSDYYMKKFEDVFTEVKDQYNNAKNEIVPTDQLDQTDPADQLFQDTLEEKISDEVTEQVKQKLEADKIDENINANNN